MIKPYHYFTSKEQVFEKVVLSFINSVKINDFDMLSTTSLKEFHANWIQNIFVANGKLNPVAKNNNEFTQNHYIPYPKIIFVFRNIKEALNVM